MAGGGAVIASAVFPDIDHLFFLRASAAGGSEAAFCPPCPGPPRRSDALADAAETEDRKGQTVVVIQGDADCFPIAQDAAAQRPKVDHIAVSCLPSCHGSSCHAHGVSGQCSAHTTAAALFFFTGVRVGLRLR